MGEMKSVNCKMQSYEKEGKMFKRFTINESRLTILFGLVMWLVGVNLYAQGPDTLWTKTYGGTGSDVGYSVEECASGGFIIAGWTNSFGAGYWDVYLIRTDADGDTLWTQTFGGTGFDYGYSVQECASGDFIIAGKTSSFGAGKEDVYLIRTNADGDTIWTKTYGGTSYDVGYSVQECASGGFIIAGKTQSFGAGYEDVYLIRTNADGDTIWTKTYGGTSYDDGYSVQECASGGFIIAGGTLSFCAGYDDDVYLIRTNADGDTIWTKTYGGTDWDRGYSVQECADGDFIIAGRTKSFGAGGEDVYLIRTDTGGDTLWTRTYGGTDSDRGYSVQECASGSFIITGETASFGAGSRDVYLIRTNLEGDTLWTKTYGGTDSDYGRSIQKCADGGFIIAGTTQSFGAGECDVWLIRTNPLQLISPNGGENWTGGSNHNIIWHHEDSTKVDHYRLLYSTNGGSDYPDTIAHNVTNTDTSYPWTLPPIMSCDSCRVKVQMLDSLDILIAEDASDSNFAIGPNVTAPDTIVIPGDTVRIAVNSTDITGLGVTSCDITLTFNSTLLEVLEAERGSLVPGSWTFTSNPSSGQIQIGLAGATELSGSGSLAIVPFIVNPLALPQDSSIIHFSDFAFNEGNIYAYTIDGKVTVSGELVDISGGCYYWSNSAGVDNVRMELSGDHSSTVFTNSDGEYTITTASGGDYTVIHNKENTTTLPAISSYDASLILRHMVEYDTLEGNECIAGEVSGDTIIMSYDAALILQYSVDKIQHFPVGDWMFDPESRSYTQLDSNITDEDYTAILYGDVSGNWGSKGFTPFAYTGDTIPVEIPHIYGEPGDTVNVPIQVGDVTGRGIISCDITLTFDSTVVEALEAITDSVVPTGWMIESHSSPGKIKIALAGADELDGSGKLVWIPFVVDSEAQTGDSSVIHFSNFIFNDGNVLTDLYDGLLSVGAGTEEVPRQIPKTFFISQNYPNPFIGSTEIEYGLPKDANVNISIYNILGQKVASLVDENKNAGYHTVRWNGKDKSGKKLASGVYFYRLEIGNQIMTKKMYLIR